MLIYVVRNWLQKRYDWLCDESYEELQLTVKEFVPHDQWERYLFRPLDEKDREKVCGRTSDKNNYHSQSSRDQETAWNEIRITALCLMFKQDI